MIVTAYLCRFAAPHISLILPMWFVLVAKCYTKVRVLIGKTLYKFCFFARLNFVFFLFAHLALILATASWRQATVRKNANKFAFSLTLHYLCALSEIL